MKKNGYGCYLVPEAEYVHYGGGSSVRKEVLLKEYYISYFLFLRKHYSLLHRTSPRLFVLIKLLFRVIRRKTSFSVFSFVLKGADERYSLRYRQ
jgi:GT2 family glycosyltransferase